MGTVKAWPGPTTAKSLKKRKMKALVCLLFFFCTFCPLSLGLRCQTCITSMGMDVACEKGQASSQECSAGEDKCLVSYNRMPGNIVVQRKCCSDSLCKEMDAPMGGGHGMWSKTCECDSCNDFDPSKGGSDNCSDRVEEESDLSSNDEDQVDDRGFVEGYWADSSSSLSANITALVVCALVLGRF